MPEADPNQVINMLEFACSMMRIFDDVIVQTSPIVGDEVLQLKLRVGFHCGKVTAGVLRSDKGRFQLFGDSVNTAARFEQNGLPGEKCFIYAYTTIRLHTYLHAYTHTRIRTCVRV